VSDEVSRTIRAGLGLPLIAAPMFFVSGTVLVGVVCRSGVIGAFPTANCRTPEQLDRWLGTIGDDLGRRCRRPGRRSRRP
jgi:nitronate monooxygenase